MRLVRDGSNNARLTFLGVDAAPQTLRAMTAADELHWEWYHREAEITSIVDGEHRPKSRHYSGLAFDLRIWYMGGEQEAFAIALRKVLGPDYDVIVERTHIHCEWDPKR